ncbi:MAG: hypothetical protein IGS03_07460 [Candidatus Sericytochromatia bacterium]|nr:hypothetical protein [Candidatus Sericytochromatia bacterium]
MRNTIILNLRQRLASYNDVIKILDDSSLNARLAVAKNKSAAEHLWCLIGARESYARALLAGEWQGFNCSLKVFDHENFAAALKQSSEQLLTAIEQINDWQPEHDALLAAIAEHEVMHEGQLIRHLYGLGLDPPHSWRWA